MRPIADRVASGAGWLYGYRWLERLLDVVSVAVLARLLTPDDFGLFAIALSMVAIIEGIAAFDVQKALIQSRDEHQALDDTAWTLSTLRGLLAALVMVVIAQFTSDPRIAEVLYVLALSPILTGLHNPRFVRFERHLIYSKLATLTLGAKILSFIATVALALHLRSFWALVAGILTSSAVSTALSYALEPYRPRFSFARFSDIFRFSGWLSLTSIVTTLSMETDKLIVGRLLGVGEAGLYFMTQRIGVLPTRELISPLQRLLFPSFSGVSDDPERLRRWARESMNVLGSLSLPAGFGFALVASDFVPLVLGDKWLDIVPLLTILVPYLAVRATLSMALPCVMALGKTRLLFWVSFVYALVHVPTFIVGTAYFDLRGTFWSLVAAGVFYTYLNAWMLHRTLGIRPMEIIAQLRRPLLAALLMGGAVLTATAVLPVGTTLVTSWLVMLAKVAVGGVTFCAAVVVLWRLEGRPMGIERRLLQVLERRRAGSSASETS